MIGSEGIEGIFKDQLIILQGQGFKPRIYEFSRKFWLAIIDFH